MFRYDLSDWYWKDGTGKIFSSKKRSIIPANDRDFANWQKNNKPSVWPRDANGTQTNDALNEVMAYIGVTVS
jgi:hypothetical protein